MRDFPIFDTANGVASLILKEVPYTGAAYIRIQSAANPEALLEDCLGFCRAVGAEAVYATGHESLKQYPLHTSVLEMRCCRDSLPETDAALFPLQEKTLRIWRELYNKRMSCVDNASYMTVQGSQDVLKNGSGYFIHRGETLLGIGIASSDRIDAVISNIPGSGKDVLLALSHVLSADMICLEVASTNHRAIHLYESLGFVVVRELSKWYKIFCAYRLNSASHHIL